VIRFKGPNVTVVPLKNVIVVPAPAADVGKGSEPPPVLVPRPLQPLKVTVPLTVPVNVLHVKNTPVAPAFSPNPIVAIEAGIASAATASKNRRMCPPSQVVMSVAQRV
jgi:hypothetical protein